MTLRTLSRFWERRLCEIALLISGSIALFYIWARFVPTGTYDPLGTVISDEVALAAALLFLLSTALVFWLPKRWATEIGIGVYGLTVALVGFLVVTSGGTSSPFLVLWMGVALFGGVFGPTVVGALIAAVVIYLGAVFAIEKAVMQDVLSMAVLGGILPCVASFILWQKRPDKGQPHSDEQADLVHRLSSVEGKSDIVINAIDDGVIALNSEGVIELINPAAQTIIGWNQGDALGLSYKSVLKLEDMTGQVVSDINDPIQRAIAQKKTIHDDTLQVITNGDKKRLLSLVASTHGEKDAGIIVVFRDITREKAEEREQAEFISTASHEMRTPVAAIEGYLGLALNPSTANIDDKARDYIGKAQDSAKHLGRLFQDLLDVSRAEDGRLHSDPQPINISSFVGEIVQSLEPKAKEKGLDYRFIPDISDDGTDGHGERTLRPIYYADVDADHLREVVANLTENAIKYTPQGEVSIDVTGTETTVTIIVKDSGIGIPAEDIPHLFQKFYRVDNTDTREIGGTGLGLYLCRRLAEAMSGRISVESEYKKGSKFFLELPRMNSEEATRQIAEREARSENEQASQAPPETTEPTPVSSAALETSQDSLDLTQAPTPPASTDAAAAVITPDETAPTEVPPVEVPSSPVPESPVTPAPIIEPAPTPMLPTEPTTTQFTPASASPTLSDIERNAAAYARQYLDTAHARHQAAMAARNRSITVPDRTGEKE